MGRILMRSLPESLQNIREGDAVHVACDPAHIHLFDAGVAGARLTPIA